MRPASPRNATRCATACRRRRTPHSGPAYGGLSGLERYVRNKLGCGLSCSLHMKNLNGIHHISAITADATKSLLFYTGVMGLRLVKKTVNQDNPSVYHLFYADEEGSPGA